MMMPEINAFIRDGNQALRSLADLLARAQQIVEESFEDHAGMPGERPELALQIKEPSKPSQPRITSQNYSRTSQRLNLNR